MKNLIARSITGTLFVAVIVAAIFLGHVYFAGLFLIAVILGQWEFYRLCEQLGGKPLKVAGTLTGTLVFVLNYWFCTSNLSNIGPEELKPFALILLLLFSVFIAELFRQTEHPLLNISYTLLGILYVVLPFSLLNYLVFFPEYNFLEDYDTALILGFFVIIWANDTGAYFVGSLIGKHKLFERVSPKKTWEGAIGGAFFALLAGYLMYRFYNVSSRELLLEEWLIYAFIIMLFGSLGDLVQSTFKRNAGVKDSGTILPGHGGILDRFDGVLLAAPFAVAYLFLLLL